MRILVLHVFMFKVAFCHVLLNEYELTNKIVDIEKFARHHQND